jgi:hypothetical protein
VPPPPWLIAITPKISQLMPYWLAGFRISCRQLATPAIQAPLPRHGCH